MATETETGRFADVTLEHAAGIAIGGLVLAGYASWMAADIVARWLVFVVALVAGGYLLSTRETTRSKIVYTIYALAVFVAVTPVMIVLPDVLSASTYGVGALDFAFMTVHGLLVLLFVILAALVAYVGYRVDGGRGVVARIRDRVGE